MNLADTSREAFAKVDLTAGQQHVLDWFHVQPTGLSATRQQIADGTGMLLQTVCGRVHELLDAGEIEELPAVDGAHPLRLNASRSSYCDGNMAGEFRSSRTQLRRSSMTTVIASPEAQLDIAREGLTDIGPVARRKHGAESGVSPRNLDTRSEAWRHECEVRLVANMPGKDYRMHYLAGVRKHRGNEAVNRIKDDLKRMWRDTMVAA